MRLRFSICYATAHMSWISRNRTALIALLLVLKVALWTWLLYTVGAERLVSYVGAENGYVIMFLAALLGGLSTFTSVTYFVTVFTLASAGLEPFGLALASSAGVSIGDVIFYYIGLWGLRAVAPGRISFWLKRATDWLTLRSRVMVFAFVYSYAAFTPFPNDVLALVLGATRQPLLLVMPALILGNFTLIMLLATFGSFLPW